jgi:hypothetical protein
MKKTFLFATAIVFTLLLNAQAPQQLNYQAVVRDANGNALPNSTPVQLRFTIHDLTAGGTAVFTETQSTTTNQFGLVNLQIGSVGNLTTVSWASGAKFLQVELSTDAGTTFTDMGTTQLVSVPYALSAGSAASAWGLSGNTGTVDSANFIGTSDFTPLNFRTGNVRSGRIEPQGFNYTTALGFHSLMSNYGYSNSAFGYDALLSNSSGGDNTAVGLSALSTNLTGNSNTAVGSNALNASALGNENTALGWNALLNLYNGSENTAVGSEALHDNYGGNYNTGVGKSALRGCYGLSNTALGDEAGYLTTYANGNTAIGAASLYNNTTGTYNTALGYSSGTSGQRDHTISIGNDTYLNAASNQAFFGGSGTVWNGGNVAWSTYSDARIKRNIQDDVKGLDFITRLHPVTYYRNSKAMLDITGNKDCKDYEGKYDIEKIKFSGFLAQEVEKAAKESGYDFSGFTAPKNDKDLYTLSYEQFVVPLVKAVQEQQQTIEQLKKRIADLEKK